MCRMVPPLSGALSETYKKEAAFRDLCEESELAQRVYDLAQEVEGLYRHASTHAAGIVISDEATRTKVAVVSGSTWYGCNDAVQYEVGGASGLGEV